MTSYDNRGRSIYLNRFISDIGIMIDPYYWTDQVLNRGYDADWIKRQVYFAFLD
jgi:hypothetical protein